MGLYADLTDKYPVALKQSSVAVINSTIGPLKKNKLPKGFVVSFGRLFNFLADKLKTAVYKVNSHQNHCDRENNHNKSGFALFGNARANLSANHTAATDANRG